MSEDTELREAVADQTVRLMRRIDTLENRIEALEHALQQDHQQAA